MIRPVAKAEEDALDEKLAETVAVPEAAGEADAEAEEVAVTATTVADALSKGYAGNMRALATLSPEVKQAIKDGASFADVIQILNNNEAGDVGWQVGEFKNVANPFGFSNTSGGSMTVGRLVYLPVFEDEGRKLLHLAISGRTMEPRRQYTSFDNETGLPTGDPINAVRIFNEKEVDELAFLDISATPGGKGPCSRQPTWKWVSEVTSRASRCRPQAASCCRAAG
jgi:hypothetical protein